MIKQATIYKFKGAVAFSSFADHQFTPCTPSQDKSIGWVPPRGNDGDELFEIIDGQIIVKLMIEAKSVPKSVITAYVDEMAESIEKNTGLKPGKGLRKELAEEALMKFLPDAFPKCTAITGWIDPAREMLVVGTASQGKVDDFVTVLMQTVGSAEIGLLNTATSPQGAMTGWLLGGGDGFALGHECVLKSNGEDAATVKFKGFALPDDAVTVQIKEGKLPTELALICTDSINFVLTESMKLKKIEFQDGVMAHGDTEEDRFDADVALTTGLLGPAIDALVAALGGEVEVEA